VRRAAAAIALAARKRNVVFMFAVVFFVLLKNLFLRQRESEIFLLPEIFSFALPVRD
jgi:hypothetical protein